MTAADAYERYKHMDALFSDHEWMQSTAAKGDSGSELARTMALYVYDLWQAVKTEARKESHEPTNP